MCWRSLGGTVTYIWLGLERLAHGEEDLQLASSEVGNAGGVVRHVGGRLRLSVSGYEVRCRSVVKMLVYGAGRRDEVE